MKKRVLLGMSGGVDSSASAILLKKMGYEVVGVTLKLCGEEETINKSIEDAKKVCEKLEIEHHVLDLKSEFQDKVINNFKCEYSNAKTPNPCIECNKYIKFGKLFEVMKKMNCDLMATGHYAKIAYSEKYKQFVLEKSKAIGKDQTYFLYGINKDVLQYIIFPLSDFENKAEIRKIASENNLAVAEKKDSQEICFIPNNDYISFLQSDNEIKTRGTGDIVLKDGTVLGRHDGLVHYTIGQRKGLGIAYEKPLYVLKLDKEKNQVIVGEEKELYSNILYAKDLNFLIDLKNFSNKINIKAKIRYRASEARATLTLQDDERIAKVEFEEPQRAITAGQSVVFYVDDIVLGGGKII